MRKYLLYLASLVLVVSSCSKSPEDKANLLIKEAMFKSLFYPDSYDPVETAVDSAFTPFDDPEFYKNTLALYKLENDIENYKNQVKKAEEDIAYNKDMLRIVNSNSNKLRLSQAQEKYDNALAEKKETEEKAQKLAGDLRAELHQQPLFIGFKARHRYRAKNKGGEIVFGEAIVLFDKDMTQIVYAWEMDDYEYKQVQEVYEYMRKN